MRGGYGGYAAWWFDNCYWDGYGGVGVFAPSGEVTHSRVRMQGGSFQASVSMSAECYMGTAAAFYGPGITHTAPQHSTLALTGTPVTGQAVLLTLNGAPGSRASMWIGRQWILQTDPGVDIELAVDRLKVIELGQIPSSGSISFPLEISGAYPPGTLLGVQGECRFELGPVRRTNSIPIVVR
jgi:hypothetical protein